MQKQNFIVKRISRQADKLVILIPKNMDNFHHGDYVLVQKVNPNKLEVEEN